MKYTGIFFASLAITGLTISSTFANSVNEPEAKTLTNPTNTTKQNITQTGGPEAMSMSVGGDRDEHGCIGSAGYSWSGSMNQCVRSWEQTDSGTGKTEEKNTKTIEAEMTGADKDEHGCIGSAGYSWSGPMKECIRTWEQYTISMPSIETGNDTFDAILTTKQKTITTSFKRRAESFLAKKQAPAKSQELDVRSRVINSGKILSVKIEATETLGGKGDKTTSIQTFNYQTKTNKLINFRQIVAAKNYGKLEKTIRNSLSKANPGIDTKKLQNTTTTRKPVNYQTFTVHTDEKGKITMLTFYFENSKLGIPEDGYQAVGIVYGTFEELAE